MSERYLRVWDIVGRPEKGIPPIFPVSKSAWYLGVKEGRFPQPVRFTKRTVFWRESDIHAFLNSQK